MKKLISMLLVLVMLMGISAIAMAEDPVTITVVTNKLGNGHPDNLEDNFVYQKILERTGVAVDLIYLDEYDTALGNRIAGDDIPDMMYLDAQHVQTYADQEILLCLDDYKDSEVFQHIFATYGEDTDIPSLYVDGHMYAIPAAMAISDYYYLILVRKDWNEKYGKVAPTTVDELYDYCYWMANNDPDGNGVKDTIGFTGFGINGLAAITSPYDVALGNYVLIRDGKVTNSVLQPRMVEALTMLKKFYDNGLLDPDIMNNSSVKANTIACNVGVSAMPWSNILKAKYVEQYKAVNPDAEYVWIPALSQGGDPCYTIAAHDLYEGFKMCINADITPEKLEAIWKVLDYMTTDEGVMLVYTGLEGVHWNYDENHQVVTTDRIGEANYTHEWQWLGRNDKLYLEIKFPEAGEATAFGLATPAFEYYNSSVVIPADFNLSDMEDYIKSQLIGFYKGDRDLAEYDKFVQELYDSYDFGTYMDMVTEQLVAQGLATE